MLRAEPGFSDLVVWTVLSETRLVKMDEMVGDARLPVLIDTRESDFKQTYGVTTAKSHLLFDRDGCLRSFDDMPPSKKMRDQLDLLLPYVAQIR